MEAPVDNQKDTEDEEDENSQEEEEENRQKKSPLRSSSDYPRTRTISRRQLAFDTCPVYSESPISALTLDSSMARTKAGTSSPPPKQPPVSAALRHSPRIASTAASHASQKRSEKPKKREVVKHLSCGWIGWIRPSSTQKKGKAKTTMPQTIAQPPLVLVQSVPPQRGKSVGSKEEGCVKNKEQKKEEG